MDPLTAFGTIGGLVLGGASLASQSQANATNMQMNRDLLAFQKYQYSDQKKYNSVQEQMRRMRAAGLNPALMMQSGTLGSVGSSVGSPSLTPYNPLDVSGAASAISSLSSAFPQAEVLESEKQKNLAEANKTEQDTIRQVIENKYADDYYSWRVDNYKGRSGLFGSQIRLNNLQSEWAEQTMKYRISESRWQMEQTAANAESAMISASYLPEQLVADIRQKISTAYMSVLSGVASVRTAMANVMNAVTNRRNSGAMYGVSESDRAKFFNATLDMMRSAADKNQSEEFRNTFFPWSYSVGSDLFGSVSHNTTEGKLSDYETWKQNRKARQQRRDKLR